MTVPQVDDRDWSVLTLGDRIRQIEVEGYLVLPDLLTAEDARRLKAQTGTLEAGCHVVSEKPACVRTRDFEHLVEVAKKKRRHLMLVFANRLLPQVQKARELIQSGFLGDFYGTEIHTIADQTRLKSPEYQNSWYASKEKAGGGHLAWLGVHYLDLIRFITGLRIQQVCGFVGNVGGPSR